MLEHEWLTSTDPAKMLEWIRLGRVAADDDYPPNYSHCPAVVSDRQLMLYACGLRRQIPHLEWNGISQGWKDIEDRPGDQHNDDVGNIINPMSLVNVFLGETRAKDSPSPATAANVLRDIVGNPLRSKSLCGTCADGVKWDAPCPDCGLIRVLNDGLPIRIAQSIHDNGTYEDLPILWDALEDAGCTNEDIRRHCMSQERCYTLGPHHDDVCNGGRIQSPNAQFTRDHEACRGTGYVPMRGPHVKGCWVISLILGES